MRASVVPPLTGLLALLLAFGCAVRLTQAQSVAPPNSRERESSAHDACRERVLHRRAATYLICHRGAAQFAHENTLEAYRAALELGADGNEVDIRATKDGVLVCFHDDMLDMLLEAWGDVSDYTWEELQQFPLRAPGPYADQCRIPTLREVFELHRAHAGLLHLDIKRPKLDRAIGKLLDEFGLWENVVACSRETGGVIVTDPRFKPLNYKGGLYLDRGEVFPAAIQAVLARPGQGVIVDDPRGALVELKRPLGRLTRRPVKEVAAPRRQGPARVDEAALRALLANAGDGNEVPSDDAAQRQAALRIRASAEAAAALARAPRLSEATRRELARRVRQRSLHPAWEHHGLDGAAALRTLLVRPEPEAVELARFVLWNDDPVLKKVQNPVFKVPPSWTDFRLKMVALRELSHAASPDAAKLCRDYLALADDEAERLGPVQFEAAAAALLAIEPKETTAMELLKHRLQVVRGRTILDLLARSEDSWAADALERGAPHALAYRVK